MSLIRRILLLCAGATVLGSAAWAVITGSISGVVTDPSGAVVSGVTIVATDEATGVQATTTSNGKGFYTFPSLGVGVYTVSFSHPGFEDRRETAVRIDVDSPLRLDAQMVVGSVATSVEVQSETLHVDTQSS